MENNTIFKPFHLAQVMFMMSKHKQTYLDWGRATGKSTVLGVRMKDISYNLPRSKTAMPGETYKQLLTRTLPSTIEGLEMLGFKKGVHYFFGGRPPKNWHWPEAYQPPLDYDGVFTFYTGACFQLISLETDTGGRGPNYDAVIGDEAGLNDITRLSNNVLASNRGNIDRFKNQWLHHSILFASSTPQTKKGRWFLDQKDAAIENPSEILYLQAPSTLNAHNLGEDFFKTCKRLMTEMQYNAEILCIRPDSVENGFYPNFSEEIHTYDASNINYLFGLGDDTQMLKDVNSKSDSDVRNDYPLDIACDWGANINCLVVGQDTQLGNQYNLINALFVKSPQTLRELGTKFCDYYATHSNRVVNFYYDHTAIFKDASRTTSFADEFTKVLQDRGWTVNRMYVGQAPSHGVRYLFWSIVHKEDGSGATPSVRYNKNNCTYLIISTQQAGAIEGKNGIEKDKRPERRQDAIHEEVTHFTDAMDTLVYFKFKNRLSSSTGYIF
jgi:hypothetical protein